VDAGSLAYVDDMQLFSSAAGRSAESKYKTLARSWRRRVLGRRASLYFWILFPAALSL
jgi:hypothetical protein